MTRRALLGAGLLGLLAWAGLRAGAQATPDPVQACLQGDCAALIAEYEDAATLSEAACAAGAAEACLDAALRAAGEAPWRSRAEARRRRAQACALGACEGGSLPLLRVDGDTLTLDGAPLDGVFFSPDSLEGQLVLWRKAARRPLGVLVLPSPDTPASTLRQVLQVLDQGGVISLLPGAEGPRALAPRGPADLLPASPEPGPGGLLPAGPPFAPFSSLGQMDPPVIEGVLRDERAALQACLSEAPSASSPLVVRFVIAGEGQVRSAELQGAEGATPLEPCLRALFLGLRFPPPPNGGEVFVRYPLSAGPP